MLGNAEVIPNGLGTRPRSRAIQNWDNIPRENFSKYSNVNITFSSGLFRHTKRRKYSMLVSYELGQFPQAHRKSQLVFHDFNNS